jgi:hypothetical protein
MGNWENRIEIEIEPFNSNQNAKIGVKRVDALF